MEQVLCALCYNAELFKNRPGLGPQHKTDQLKHSKVKYSAVPSALLTRSSSLKIHSFILRNWLSFSVGTLKEPLGE